MRILIAVLFTAVAWGQNWQPAPVTLKTPWGEKVAPGNAWREYPRPQFVRERWENLNVVGLRHHAQDRARSGEVRRADSGSVRMESSLSGAGKTLTPENRLWERR